MQDSVPNQWSKKKTITIEEMKENTSNAKRVKNSTNNAVFLIKEKIKYLQCMFTKPEQQNLHQHTFPFDEKMIETQQTVKHRCKKNYTLATARNEDTRGINESPPTQPLLTRPEGTRGINESLQTQPLLTRPEDTRGITRFSIDTTSLNTSRRH